MENKSKKMLILLGVIVVIVLIIVVAALQSKKTGTPGTQTNQPGTETTGTPEEVTPSAEAPAPVVNEVLKDATIAAPGASAITKDNKVVTLDGKQTVNNVAQTSPLAPSESGPVKKEALAPSVIKLDVSAAGFTPNSFTVKPGQAVSVSITGIDFAHALVFEDPSLAAIGIGVYAKETRVISFNAPDKAGSYTFFCNVGNHRSRGEVGTMIVK